MTPLAPTRANSMPKAPTVNAFVEQMAGQNPFWNNRVLRPSPAENADADTVHQRQFLDLVNLARQTCATGQAIGVVVWGEAGVGKSHLLARLSRWADRESASFVYLQNVQASPENLPRSLLRAVLSILTRGRQDHWSETPLFQAMAAAVHTACERVGGDSASDIGRRSAYQQLIDSLSADDPYRAALVDRVAYDVLFRFYESVQAERDGKGNGQVAALAVRWLSGDYLDLDEANALGLPPLPRRDEAVTLVDDQAIKLVFVALSQLAWFQGRPLVLCFDQVDNLETEQIAALSRFLHALLDSVPNLLVITCGVYETLAGWKANGTITTATWNRLGQYEIAMPRISTGEARQIIQVRLDRFLEPLIELADVKARLQVDHLFPLGLPWFEQTFRNKPENRPRDVINAARDGWEQQQALAKRAGARWLRDWYSITAGDDRREPTPEELTSQIDARVKQKLQEHVELRRLHPENLPADAANMAGLLETLLERLDAVDPDVGEVSVQRLIPTRRAPRPPYDLSFHATQSHGLLFLATSSALSTTHALRRLLDAPNRPDMIWLVTDARQPLKIGPRGQEFLGTLRQQLGPRWHERQLTFDEYAALDALEAIIGMARAGDLEVPLPRGRAHRVSEDEVLASYRRQHLYAQAPLLAELLHPTAGASTPAPPPEPRQPEVELRQFIMARLALNMGMSSQELATAYVKDEERLQRTAPNLVSAQKLIEGAVHKLHADGLVQATPCEGGLYILMR